MCLPRRLGQDRACLGQGHGGLQLGQGAREPERKTVRQQEERDLAVWAVPARDMRLAGGGLANIGAHVGRRSIGPSREPGRPPATRAAMRGTGRTPPASCQSGGETAFRDNRSIPGLALDGVEGAACILRQSGCWKRAAWERKPSRIVTDPLGKPLT